MNQSRIGIVLALLAAVVWLSSCNTKVTKMAKYSGEDLSKDVMIKIDKDNKAALLEINLDEDWKLYAGTSVDSIELRQPILEGRGSGSYPLNMSVNGRYYFMLETHKGTMLLAERHLPMVGGYNFRDLGGFRTQDGRYTKWGKIFRSDELTHLTDADLDYLSGIPLKTIVDFRSQLEIDQAPDKNPASLKQNIQLSIEPGNLSGVEQLAKLSEEEMEGFMVELNEMLVTKSEIVDAYRQFFALLQSDNDVPLMFHCSAGKDRTGMGAALILYALGVDEKTIIEDYLSSNVYLGDKYAPMKAKHPNFAALFEVRPHYLQAGLDRAKAEYGSIENYLTDVLKVDTAKMREKYLY